MTLKDWLTSRGLTVPAFAAQVGLPRSTVTKYIYRTRRPRPEHARLIIDATAGAVTAEGLGLIAARERGLDITAEDLIGVERSAPTEAA